MRVPLSRAQPPCSRSFLGLPHWGQQTGVSERDLGDRFDSFVFLNPHMQSTSKTFILFGLVVFETGIHCEDQRLALNSDPPVLTS